MYGYHDRLAWIDLTRGTTEIREIGTKDLTDFIGGANLGAACWPAWSAPIPIRWGPTIR
jgi:aldehyde:ferredoxin oxidoreductase